MIKTCILTTILLALIGNEIYYTRIKKYQKVQSSDVIPDSSSFINELKMKKLCNRKNSDTAEQSLSGEARSEGAGVVCDFRDIIRAHANYLNLHLTRSTSFAPPTSSTCVILA